MIQKWSLELEVILRSLFLGHMEAPREERQHISCKHNVVYIPYAWVLDLENHDKGKRERRL